MEQRQVLCCDPKETIDGFNLNFCKALLAKLEQLRSEKRIFDEDGRFTRIGASVLNHLSDQIRCNTFNEVSVGSLASGDDAEDISMFIENAKEFLSIFEFEEDKPSKIIGGIDPAFCELLLKKLEAMQLLPYNTRAGAYIELNGAAATYLNHLTERILKSPTNYKISSNIEKSEYEQIITAVKAFLTTLKEYKG